MSRIIFYTGKGGVGKSSLSALTALNLAEQAKDTLLISLDPAHNLHDIFQSRFSEKPEKISEKLSVIQIDTDKQTKKYLQKTIEQIEKNYRYQTALGIKNYFKVLKYAPGLEEYALLNAFAQIITRYEQKEYLIFDMPPSGMSLQFFSLAQNSLIWLNELIELRKAILNKKEIISKIKFGKKEIETDKVNNTLHKLRKEHKHLIDVFQAENTRINIVLNPEDLSINEATRLNSGLNELNLKTAHFILNKYTQDAGKTPEFPNLIKFPQSNVALSGINNLKQYISGNEIREKLNQCVK